MSSFICGTVGRENIGGIVVSKPDSDYENNISLLFKRVGFSDVSEYDSCYPGTYKSIFDDCMPKIRHLYQLLDKATPVSTFGSLDESDIDSVGDISHWFLSEFGTGNDPMVFPKLNEFEEDFGYGDSRFWFWFCEDWNESLIDEMKNYTLRGLRGLGLYDIYLYGHENKYNYDDFDLEDEDFDEDDEEIDDNEIDDDAYDEDDCDN